MNETTKDGIFRIPMQFFAENGESNADSGNGAENTDNQADNKADNGTENKVDNNNVDIEKLVQKRADKLNAESGKKIAALQKELDKLKKEKMTAEELKQLEMSEKEQALAEREKQILDKENRLLAVKAIEEAGLNKNNKTFDVVDLILTPANSEEDILNKVKTIRSLLDDLSKAEIDERFKKSGRNPNNGERGGNDSHDTSIAEKLGKARAERNQKSNDILKYYTGR
jgi:hypothetical protein